MSDPKAEMKARLLAKAKAAIEEVLANSKPPGEATLADIEQSARHLGQEIAQALTVELTAASAAAVTDWPNCPGCGRRLRVKGKRRRTLVLETGEVTVARAYYHCAACKTGVFPLDKRWEVTQSVYSPERAKQMVWLAGLLPYAQAAAVFERIGHCAIPVTGIWRETQAHGERLRAHVRQQQDRVAVERVVLPPAGQDHQQRQGVSLDGGTMHIRGEGWKEFKVGTVYEIVTRPEKDPETGEVSDQPHGERMSYCAVLGSAGEFAPALWALAVERQVPQAAELSVTADGAEWIWNLVADHFPDAVQIVDWYHATQHLAQAAEALYPRDEAAAQRWQQERRQPLYLGQIQRITEPLEQAGLAAQARYFHTHQRRMQYQTFREDGYPIGSGTVESGIKRFKQRLSGPGMRWSRPAAERMLVIRAAILSDTFDTLWTLSPN